VCAEGNMDQPSLKSMVSGFGGLHSFRLANGITNGTSVFGRWPVYLAEFFDCRHAIAAMENLNDRNIFGIRIRIVPLHAIASAIPVASSRIPFPSEPSKSQPSSPLTSAFPQDGSAILDDTRASNSSPFFVARDLDSPNIATAAFTGSGVLADYASHRRISTGSVKRSPSHASLRHASALSFSNSSLGGGGTDGTQTGHATGPLSNHLHQSSSEQDLRRRAAVNANVNASLSYAAGSPTRSGFEWGSIANGASVNDHVRRTSDTFCFDALRRAANSVSTSGTNAGANQSQATGAPFPLSLDRLGTRTRAISESSASPRVISPSESTGPLSSSGFGLVVSQRNYETDGSGRATAPENSEQQRARPTTPENNSMSDFHSTSYSHAHARDLSEENSIDRPRNPTESDSSPGGPRTPPPQSGVATGGYSDVGSMYTPGSYYSSPTHLVPQGPPHMNLMGMSMGMNMGYPSPTAPGGMLPPHHPGASPYYLPPPPPSTATSPRYDFGSSALGHGRGSYAPRFAVCGVPDPDAFMHMFHAHSPGAPGHTSVHSSSLSPGGMTHLPAAARSAIDVTREAPPERNQIDLGRIAAGLDTRTTVMIKNIPNKLSDKELIEFIGRVCPRKIDFLYLRMDFQNGEIEEMLRGV
jgi:hypothetical protein